MEIDGFMLSRPRMRWEAGLEDGCARRTKNDGKCMKGRVYVLEAMRE
jgi:hypothetical protein